MTGSAGSQVAAGLLVRWRVVAHGTDCSSWQWYLVHTVAYQNASLVSPSRVRILAMSGTLTVVIDTLFGLYTAFSLAFVVCSTVTYISSLCIHLYSHKPAWHPARHPAATPSHRIPAVGVAPTFGSLLDAVVCLLPILDSLALSRLVTVIGNQMDSPLFLFFCDLLVG